MAPVESPFLPLMLEPLLLPFVVEILSINMTALSKIKRLANTYLVCFGTWRLTNPRSSGPPVAVLVPATGSKADRFTTTALDSGCSYLLDLGLCI
jgi:hypothetical protein